MQHPRATVIIPTLHAGDSLSRCLDALRAQTCDAFETIVVDNSGRGAGARFAAPPRVRVIENRENAGFGQAVNQGIAASRAEFICTLNDDAYPAPDWLANLLAACEADPEVGMCASQIRLRERPGLLDSAGLAIYPDGTTKQRGHRAPAEAYPDTAEVLLPSGCAALYRRSTLAAVGGFDPDYFLYGEDADVGLRARLAGWKCLYVPAAVVEHDYSGSAGRASPLKAFYVERNRLRTVVKTFPVVLWLAVPWYSLWRYLAHAWAMATGRGLASDFHRQGEKWWRLMLIVGSAYWSVWCCLPDLLRKRRKVRRTAVLGTRAFWNLLRRHHVSAARIALQ